MATKPLIGINGDFRPAKKDATALSWFNTGYYDSIIAAGGLPMPIPPYADDADLKQFMGMLDGAWEVDEAETAKLRAQLAKEPAATLELVAWRDASWFEGGSPA